MLKHGGDIYKASVELNIPENRIIDFSASINPLGISKNTRSAIIKNINNLHSYPDNEARQLRKCLSERLCIDAGSILCGNGSTELIYLIPQVIKPERVLIAVPTFSEYETGLRRAECEGQSLNIKYFVLNEKNKFEMNPDEFISSLEGGSDGRMNDNPYNMAFICNPNNPTGNLLKKDSILKIADAAKDLRCYLVVDEAFMDFCDGDSVIQYVKYNPYLIVLRSLTKFYALSGLRLGYAVIHGQLIEKFLQKKEPWTVNTLAQHAGIAALTDASYCHKTLNIIKKEKEYLENGFNHLGLDFIKSYANYYLIKIKNGSEAVQNLRQKGILVRDCSNFTGLNGDYIRVAVRLRKENKVLLEELKKLQVYS
jgi:threonine-phosphate decarboxylase